MNLSEFEIRIDFCFDFLELVFSGEEIEKCSQTWMHGWAVYQAQEAKRLFVIGHFPFLIFHFVGSWTPQWIEQGSRRLSGSNKLGRVASGNLDVLHK